MSDNGIIDLRSDTVTKPTKAMREAMYGAEVGDDVIDDDPTALKLQEKAAHILGMQAALFVSSGTMGNQVCINVLTGPGQEIICSSTAHILHDELAGLAINSGVSAVPIDSPYGYITAEQVEEKIRPDVYYYSKTGLIEIENTMNYPGGRVFPQEEVEKILKLAEKRSIPLHLDGARIFNAAVASKRDVKELVRGFDSVSFCMSKGLGAPIGSVVAGSKDFIEEARRVRYRLGGGMRQVGIMCAAGLYSLENNVQRLEEDHRNAGLLADGLMQIKGIRLAPENVETNMVYFDPSGTGLSADEFMQRLKEKGVLSSGDSRRIRMVTHLDVDSDDIKTTLKIVEETLSN